MPPLKITAKTGNAPITKLGHTAGNHFGQNAANGVKNVGRSEPRPLSGK